MAFLILWAYTMTPPLQAFLLCQYTNTLTVVLCTLLSSTTAAVILC